MASLRPSPTSSANENRSQFPENHRGTEFTEKTQSHLSSSLEPIFLNAKTRRRKATRSLTQRRRDAENFSRALARTRPSNDGRVPLGQTTAPNASVRRGVPAQRPALCERRPRRSSFSFHDWEGTPPSPIGEKKGGTDTPPARRPVGRLAATSACAWSGRTFHRRSAIVRSPAVPPSIHGTLASHQRQPLCVFASLRLCVLYWLVRRLCVSATLRLCVFFSVSPSVSPYLCGFSVG